MRADAGELLAVTVLAAVCERLLSSEARFDTLDRAIGDGDHGQNLSRAARRLGEIRDQLALVPLPQIMQRSGKEIVMSVGGASGPLYGTLLLEIGKALPAQPSLGDWAAAFTDGVEAVARRGRAKEGDKTMLDVLAPAARALRTHAADKLETALQAMSAAAVAAFKVSRPLRARRGRAAFVGERSIGADDPGAASSLLCLCTIVETLSEIRS
jgi:dihydroxyacetone kinase-like protein